MDASDARALIEREYDLIRGVVSELCRKKGLRGDDADSFASYFHSHLVHDDYRVIRSFSGRSSLRTYLRAVAAHAYLDFRIARSGKWRPSAVARRNGRAGELLDQYLNRDGHALEEAIRLLLSREDCTETEEELRRLAAEIPRRAGRHFVDVDHDPSLHGDTAADEELLAKEREAAMKRIWSAVERALSTLDARERAILLLHHQEGMSVADISRTMKVDQRPLYRLIPRLRDRIRGLLESEGIGPDNLRQVLDL